MLVHHLSPVLSATLFTAVLLAPLAAQNLVPNTSFESYTTCPSTIDQTNRCVAWSSPTNGTPDFHHGCHTSSIVGVPTNVWGSQAARTGKGYTSCIDFIDASGSVAVSSSIFPLPYAPQLENLSTTVSITR